jgi:hypothetical protein
MKNDYRTQGRAHLDAYYGCFYGLTPDELCQLLDPITQ